MGSTSSKADKNDALRLCKERRKYIKQAIESRYNLAAAHVSYINSLKNIGVALRRFVEAEILIESSLSTASATELDNEKTPSHSSYPSPSLSHLAEISDSPLHNESPNSPPVVNLRYMRAGFGGIGGVSGNAVTIKVNLNHGVSTGFVVEEDESLGFSMAMPPPPPPPPSHFESGSSWDFFDPSDDCESFRFVGHSELVVDFGDVRRWNEFRGDMGGVDDNMIDAKGQCAKLNLDGKDQAHEGSISFSRNVRDDIKLVGDSCSAGVRGVENCAQQAVGRKVEQVESVGSGNGLALESSGSKKMKALAFKGLPPDREDASEFITHRAKDFLSSIKDIEHRFLRASEAGKEVSRMLEASNFRIGYLEATGRLPTSAVLLAAFRLVCCRGRTAHVSHDPTEHVAKVITWKRTTSSRSSSSRNPLASGTKDDISDSGSDFAEEFCMIAGSHSSTLDRLHAWERKLFDEVKASEPIRKEYDRKCDQLRHQFAKDMNAQVIDKTRAVIKDLYSRIKVAIHTVDTISKRIEKMRDDELQPQLLELIHALIRMWKAMLECHHAQYITISLAYHTRSIAGAHQEDSRRQIMAQLLQEVECFGLSFANWVNIHAFYVESLNGWLHNCIILPQECSKSRRPFSPRRSLAPPIFVLCRDWSAGIKALPSEELGNAIKAFLSDLQHQMEEEAERLGKKEELVDGTNGVANDNDEEKSEVSTNLCCMHASLTKLLDRLHKFSDASLKMYEDVRQKTEAARVAYSNGRPTRH